MGCISHKTQYKSIQAEFSPENNSIWTCKGPIKVYYQMVKQLSQSSFGFVWLATHKLKRSGKKLVIKSIDKSSLINGDAERNKFISEIEFLRKADHPNIVKLYDAFEDEEQYHLITEYIQGGELFDYIIKSKIITEKIAAHFMIQLLSAVLYCHNNNIMHGNLKPENLLLETEANNANLKVIGFGTPAIKPWRYLTQKNGNAYYIAPEIFRNDYNEKCDIWSCGVILYILLSGEPPFNGKDDKEIIKRVKKGKYSMEGVEWENISSQAKQLIRKMLDVNPQTRISASEAIHDEWICKYTNSDL